MTSVAVAKTATGNLNKKLTTEDIATMFSVEPQTPRASLCRNGHWMGLRPIKLPNGRLLWDQAEAERLLSGGAA